MVPGRRLLAGAAALGLIHAAASAYWALGGDRLVDTVGSWARQWREDSPVTATAVLLTVTLVKVGGAVVPLLVASGRLPRRPWRALCWLGAAVLASYGLANTAGAWVVLVGWVDSPAADPASPDHPALLGHALLWDPLFAAWGVLLGLGLWRGRAASPR